MNKPNPRQINYIEFIGPPGVGKTTLFNLLVSNREKDSNWVTYQEAISNIADTISWEQLKNLKSTILYLLNKINLTQYKKQGICTILANELRGEIPHSIQTKYEYLMGAQLKAVASLNLNISSINKYSLLSWHLKSLEKAFLLEVFNYQRTVILTEGPFKTHYGLDYINLNQMDMDTIPRAVIYCTTSAEENLKRIQTRFVTTGKLSKIHTPLNNENLYFLVELTHDIAEKNLTFIKSLGVPTTEIDLTNPVTDYTIRELNHFISTYSNPTKYLTNKYAVI